MFLIVRTQLLMSVKNIENDQQQILTSFCSNNQVQYEIVFAGTLGKTIWNR